MNRRSYMLGLFFVCLAAWSGSAPAQSDLVSTGRDFAELVCGSCHVVSDKYKVPILRNPGPSFAAIAARTSTTDASLRDYLQSAHREMGRSGRMPNPRLQDYEIDEVVAYILSLREP